MRKIRLPKLRCHRCGNVWIPRSERPPKVCPSCNSPYWHTPRRERPDTSSKV